MRTEDLEKTIKLLDKTKKLLQILQESKSNEEIEKCVERFLRFTKALRAELATKLKIEARKTRSRYKTTWSIRLTKLKLTIAYVFARIASIFSETSKLRTIELKKAWIELAESTGDILDYYTAGFDLMRLYIIAHAIDFELDKIEDNLTRLKHENDKMAIIEKIKAHINELEKVIALLYEESDLGEGDGNVGRVLMPTSRF